MKRTGSNIFHALALLPLLLCLPAPVAAGPADRRDRTGDDIRPLGPTTAIRSAPEFSRYTPPAPVCRIVAIEQVQASSDGPGGLFRIGGEVPAYMMAGVELWMPSVGKWVATEDEVMSVDGAVSFHVWSAQPSALFRISARPFPRVELLRDGEPHLHLTEALREDHLWRLER